MKFVIEDKIYDTEKAEKIIEYPAKRPVRMLTGTVYTDIDTTLYKTKKGNWFSVSKYRDQYAGYKETDESVKKLFKDLNNIELHAIYFEELEEA